MPQTKTIDTYLAVPLAGVAYALIAFPLIISACNPVDFECAYASRPESKLVWPTLAAISVFMVARNWRRFSIPPHIVCLLVFLAFAGASVLWAFRPEISAIRYAQQVMIITSVVLPALIMTGRGDLMRGLFLCFALACVINLFFVVGLPPVSAELATVGHTGYFQGKNYLGICAAISLLLAIHEMMHRGWRRWSGLVVSVVAIALLYLGNSKTAVVLALLTPALAWLVLVVRKSLRVPVLVLPLTILAAYVVVSTIVGFDVYKLSYQIYGDSTFTGRKYIWEFAFSQIAERPFLGWGYQSFWLVGPDAPSIVKAPGWIKTMPNAHNGYIDVRLEMGYVGIALLLAFVAMTVHAAGRVIDRDPKRGWIILTLMLSIIIYNGFESLWMRGFEFVWLVFLILAADVGRQLQLYRFAEARENVAPRYPVRTRRRRSEAHAGGTA